LKDVEMDLTQSAAVVSAVGASGAARAKKKGNVKLEGLNEAERMKFDDLTFVRVIDPNIFALIPQYLFEQVEGRSWSVERLYKFAPLFLTNDSNCFWVLENKEKVKKGVLWVVIDVLSEKLNVIVFSVDEEYQDTNYLKSARDFLRQFIKDFNGIEGEIKIKETINWVTSRPELFDEIGGRRPKTIMVEV